MKKLFLLGLLRRQNLHGYGLVDYLKSHSTSGAAIGKSNAYRLLKLLEEEGSVKSWVERDGKRPERNVYKVTTAGEALFQKLVLEALAEDATADLPGIAVLNYLDELDPLLAAGQLEKRRQKVMRRYEELKIVPEEVLYLHPAMDLAVRQLEIELDWLTRKLKQLHKRTTNIA